MGESNDRTEYFRQYREANRERLNKYHREYYKKNRARTYRVLAKYYKRKSEEIDDNIKNQEAKKDEENIDVEHEP